MTGKRLWACKVLGASVLWLASAAAADTALEAGAPKVLTPEIVENLVSASEAAISPDGGQVLYRKTVPRAPDEEDGAARHELWVVPAEGGASRRFVGAASDPSAARWSPDGRWISFLSSRKTGEEGDSDAKTRIFVMPSNGGEARPLTPKDLSVALYAWAPSSASVAFVAEDPEPEDRKQAKKKGADWTIVDQEVPARRLRAIDLVSQAAREITGANLFVWEIEWSPDGHALVAAVTDTPRTDDQYLRKRLIVVPAEGGEPSLLVPAKGKLASPVWSPDGKWVAFLGATDKYDPSEGTVFIVPASGGQPRALAAGSEIDFRRLLWLPSGKLVASGEEGVQSVVALLSSEDGKVTRLLDRDLIVDRLSASKDGSRLALCASTPRHPSEVFSWRMGAEAPARLTFHNEGLAALPLGEQGSFRWRAKDGQSIEGVLIKPVGFQQGRRHPLIVTPHGGPEFASLNGWAAGYLYLGQVAAGRGYFVLLPNYRGSTGRGEAFARADHKDLGGAEFDDVLAGIDALAEKGWIDPARVGIAGGSYGGYFAALAAARHADRFAATVVFAGITNWISYMGTADIPEENSWVHWGVDSYLDHLDMLWGGSPLARIASARTPTLILHGEKDLRVPVSQGSELYTALRLKGIPAEMVIYPREGHGLRERAHRIDCANRILEWFDRHLKGKWGLSLFSQLRDAEPDLDGRLHPATGEA